MIISILGMSGMDKDKANKTTAHYDCTALEKMSGDYHNATDMLLKNYDDSFYFLGTQTAIDFQKSLLSYPKDKSTFIPIEDNSLDDIFERIYELLDTDEDVVLDITHGFRHQPIMAIFASTLSQFLERKNLNIIFAKEVEQFKKYEYIQLDNYIEITQLSLLLSGFIQTLNFIPIKNMKLLNNKVFEDFSKSLLSNDLKGVQKNYKNLSTQLDKLSKQEALKHLFNLFTQVKEELSPLETFQTDVPYIQYKVLAKLTIEKNYLVVSLAYIFEALREYCSVKLTPCITAKDIKFKNSYIKNTATMDTIGNFIRNRKPNALQKAYPSLHKENKNTFMRISTIYDEVRTLRNDLAHINQTKDFNDIKQQLQSIIFKTETIFKDDVLKHITI